MKCAGCSHENRAGRKFCAECGAALALACAACGAPYEAGEKFCGECGGSLGSPERPGAVSSEPGSAKKPAPAARGAADAGARKIVTIVFADLVGSTALHERIDAESAQQVMERYYDALRGAVDAHAGTVVKLLGDGVMAAFGLRQVAEDDALRAVRAGVAMQEAFHELVGLQPALAGAGLRVAVNTGEVVVSGALDDVIGDPVNVAARLQEQARDGDVVVGEETRRLVAQRVTLVPLGSVTLKGRAGAVAAYRVESLEAPAGATATAFVGRDDEVARLVAVYDAATDAPAARLAVLLGSPGLGKSRLIDELGRRLGDGATLLGGHCDAAGGATFAPIAMALRAHLGIDDALDIEAARAGVAAALVSVEPAERSRIATGIAALLTGSPAAPEETFFVVRRLLAALAREKPAVLVIDDVHWAEPLLLDLVEHLIQWGAGVPLFVLVAARPELRDVRSSLVTPGTLVSDVITLGGLDAAAAMRLAASVIGASDLPAAVAGKVLATSEGNPLFVGELVRMLVQEGALAKEGERWTASAGLAAIEMPPTIHALLAARIERLRPDERTVLERAAVVGRHFSRSAVAALLGRNGSELDARLEALRRSELIERDTGWLLGEPALRFHHVLIRDAAYRRLLKGTRAELHERLADWIEAKVGDASEHDETIGRHLEQAHQLLGELGPVDAHGKTLGERAAGRLAAAGRRALARDDVPLAAGLLGRAIERLDADDPARADLALDWCEALLSAGEVGPAAGAIAELERFAQGSARLRGWHTCFAAQLAVMTAPEELHDAAERVASAARDLAKLEDAGGEAKAHFVHAQALARLGKVGACEAALDQALAAARRAGDRRRANAVLAGAPLAALWGPSPVTRASGRCLDVVRVLRITQGAPAVEAVALSCQGVLEALRGRTDAARRMLAASRTMVEELGITQRLYEADVFIGRVDLLEGDAASAEQRLRPAYEGLRDLGLGIDAARAAALLGRALLAQGRAEEAERLSSESELLAGDDLQAAIAWRGVRAEALAARGEHDAAVALATKAVEIAAATDALLDHADARVALAAALRAAGGHAEADAEGRRALELWDTKGATLLAERAAVPAVAVAPSSARPSSFAERAARRRFVRQNFAIEKARLTEAAVAARDVGAIESVYRHDVEIVDHQYGRTYGYAEIHERLQMYIEQSSDSVFVHEPLATLGDSLALLRLRITASGAALYGSSTGPTEVTYVILMEADERGRARRVEIFNDEKLNEALVRLFARYAELLPQGAERVRTAGAARALADMLREQQQREWLASALAPDVECIDHRLVSFGTLHGKAAVLEAVGAFLDLVEDMRWRVDDVVEVTERAVLALTTNSGTNRVGGGAFERAIRFFVAFDEEGLIVRWEIFEASDEAAALARFAELARGAVPPARVARRVSRNAAAIVSEQLEARLSEQLEARLAERDETGIAAGYSDDLEVIDHPNGAAYGLEAHLRSLTSLLRMQDATLRSEPLATLGDSLLLFRRRIHATGMTSRRYDVGEVDREDIVLLELAEALRVGRMETFAGNSLGDAIARLYSLHAESLPEGADRERAALTARAVAYLLTRANEPTAETELYAPTYLDIDHRSVGYGKLNLEDSGKLKASFGEVADDVRFRIDDILALTTHGLVRKTTTSGTWRDGGGPFERTVCTLSVFGPDGRVTGHETFEADREAEALARFDELTGGAARPRHPARRRVRENAASRGCARFDATLAARDADALERHLVESMRLVHHPTGATYGRRGMLATWRSAFKAERFEFRRETLATLGETLVLSRQVTTVDGLAEEHLKAFGPTEVHELSVVEMDERGGMLLAELFAPDRLGDALVRLYEIYAERSPNAAGRACMERIARFYAASNGPVVPERLAAIYDPTSRIMDHRVLATWTAHGRDEILGHWRTQLDLAPDFAGRYDDVLAFDPRVVLVRMTYFGTGVESGGAFENPVLVLSTYAADGGLMRSEVFEAEDEAAALARFDALTQAPQAEPPRSVRRPVRPNRATKNFAGIEAAFDRRDLAALEDLLGDPLETVEHPTHTTYGRAGQIETCKIMLRFPDLKLRGEPLATLGESLGLFRRLVTASGTVGNRFDVGSYEVESIVVNEVDTAGRLSRSEVFAADRLCQATARFYELYAETLSDGAERVCMAGIARSFALLENPLTLDRIAAATSDSFVLIDHRSLATWSSGDKEEWIRHEREQMQLVAGWSRRDEDILAFAPIVHVTRHVYYGTGRASGGLFENVFLSVNAFDADGRWARFELFEPEQESAALARFDELVGGAASGATPTEHPFTNLAVRCAGRLGERWRARDWDGFAVTLAPGFRFEDRRAMSRIVLDREQYVAFSRQLGDMASTRLDSELLASRGERLSLTRLRIDIAGGDVGPSDLDYLYLHETDETGDRFVAAIAFDSADLEAAYAELDARWRAVEAATYPRAMAYQAAFVRALANRDWEGVAGLHAPSLVAHDHRLVGWDVVEEPAAYVGVVRTMIDLAPDVQNRLDHIRMTDRGHIAEVVWVGTRDGGAFESAFVWVVELDADGRARRHDLYDPHHVARAFARFDEIRTAAVPAKLVDRFANAAWRWVERFGRAYAVHDWPSLTRLFAENMSFDERRPLLRLGLELGRNEFLEQHRVLFDVPNSKWTNTLIATRGERLVLARLLFHGDVDGTGGALEIDHLAVLEVDRQADDARLITVVLFAPEDADGAYAELERRFEAGEGAEHGETVRRSVRMHQAFVRNLALRDWEAIAAACAPGFAEHDHRPIVGLGTTFGVDAWVQRNVRTCTVLAPDTMARWRHLRVGPGGVLWQLAWEGSREGGIL